MDLDWGPISGIFFRILEAFVLGFAGIFGFLQDSSGIFNLFGSFLVVIAWIIALPLSIIGGVFEWIGL